MGCLSEFNPRRGGAKISVGCSLIGGADVSSDAVDPKTFRLHGFFFVWLFFFVFFFWSKVNHLYQED